jgi:hypothetical protein
MLAVIVVVLLALIGPVMVTTLTASQAVNTYSVQLHGAYAAVEAGIQAYRNNIDNVQSYATWTVSNANPNDCAMISTAAASTAACPTPGWQQVFAYPNGSTTGVPTNPAEYYHYAPNNACVTGASSCPSTVSAFAKGHLLLTVTGRSGSPIHWGYQTSVVSFSKYSSYFEDNYYSNYEVLDPNYAQGDAAVTITPSTCSPVVAACQSVQPESTFTFNYQYTNDAGIQIKVNNTSLLNALCSYYGYQENNFINSLSDTNNTNFPSASDQITNSLVTGQYFGHSYPYYGAFLGFPGSSTGTLYNVSKALSFKYVDPSGLTETLSVTQPCATPYDFNSGESFSGPVFSNDELHMCGSPGFNGSPVSLLTATPADATFKYNWPGSLKVGNVYTARGWTIDPDNCGGSPSPTLTNGLSLGVQELLPQFDEKLSDYTTGVCPVNQAGCNVAAYQGCIFTGPTMIELDYNQGGDQKTTLNVWSPLSRSTDGCGTFSPSTAFQTGIALPPNGVVYVQDTPATPTDPNYWCPTTGCPSAAPLGTPTLPTTSGAISPVAVTSGTCFLNPEQSSVAPNASACTEGDTFVEGELQGELTIGSEANVYVTRNITYQCADGAAGTPASATVPAVCATAAVGTLGPDILGLYANQDVFLSHPMNTVVHPQPGQSGGPSGCNNISLSGFTYYFCSPGSVGGTGVNNCTSNSADTTNTWYCEPAVCAQDGTTANQNSISYVLPNCDIKNPVVDGAVIALKGSFGIQGWNEGGGSTGSSPCVSGAGLDGCMYLNGADVAYYRGPFGITGWTGYYKEFSFDNRLAYLAPPDAITAAVTNWYVAGVAWCGGRNTAGSASPTPTCPASAP